MKNTTLEQRTVEPIVLGNLALDGEAVRGDDGKYLLKTQHGWMEHLAGSGTRLPTLPEYFAFIHYLQKENHPASEGLLKDLVESGLCVGTQFCYHKNNNAITHFGDGNPLVIPCFIPTDFGYLNKLVKVNAWRKVLHGALQYANVDEAVEAVKVLQKFSGKRPHIWTSSAESRKSTPERAVWLGSNTDRFYLSCYNYPIVSSGRARRVRRLERCEAPRVKNGGVYRTPAKTQEEVLDEKLSEIVGTFRQLKSPATAELYDELEQQALQNLTKLYHGK